MRERQPLLSVEDVSKTFVTRSISSRLRRRPANAVRALNKVTVKVASGKITALLGPNGAGKTTLMNTISDLVRADQGQITVAGWPVPESAQEACRHIGFVTANERSFFWRLSGRQNLEFFAALYDLPPRVARRRCDELLDQFDLGDQADRIFRTFSAGRKKRLALARALIHDPEVLLMDEPTNSLDAAAVEEFYRLVRTRLVTSNKCVLWATHRIEEVAEVCDHVVVLAGGQVHFDGTVAQFDLLCRSKSGYVVELHASTVQPGIIGDYARSINAIIETSGQRARLVLSGVHDAARVTAVLSKLIELGATIQKVEPGSLSLHQVFTRLAEPKAGPLALISTKMNVDA
ncbi:MAG: ABC transporter ATP-binding protein [Planctomycetes bacterium]|nr:ABC transporter ATP-binding protein [Planctomycetota bacterium]